MHINHLWTILNQNPELDFLAASPDRLRAKHIVTRLILNTDMAFHNKNLESLKTLVQYKGFDPKRNSQQKWVRN
jgi:hypothetical protein